MSERTAAVGRIVRVASGNFLEMYDFIVYGYYATYIADAFFPVHSRFASLMLLLTTFGVGYLMRPVGALVLGSYIDRNGRRRGLIVTLGLMAVGTLTIAITPGYRSIGLLAPAIVVAGRLLQGLSAGVELGGVSVYLTEIATPGHRGFYCSWQSASQQVAVIFTALIGLGITTLTTAEQMGRWGWRVPLIIGCLIVPLILWLRRSLEETEAFKRGARASSTRDVLGTLVRHWRIVVLGMMLSGFTTTTFYLITAYTPTFGRQALHFDMYGALRVTLCVGVSNLIWVPAGGALSDVVGRRPLLLAMPALGLITAYPALAWLAVAPTLAKLLTVELWFSFFFGIYNGAMIPFVIESMPPTIKTAGFALSFSLATALLGGFTPAIATYLIQVTGNRAAPALWLSFAAIISLTAAVLATPVRVAETNAAV